MSEFILELYSEEIPPNLQISARNDLQEKIKNSLIEENIKYGSLSAFSSGYSGTCTIGNSRQLFGCHFIPTPIFFIFFCPEQVNYLFGFGINKFIWRDNYRTQGGNKNF